MSKEKISHFNNGQIQYKIHYVGENRHGLETWWREDGSKEWEAMRKDGKAHGGYAMWHKDGKNGMEWEEMWREGKRQGIQTWWHEDGTKQLEIYYIEGHECARIERYEEEGNITEINFPNSTINPAINSTINPAKKLKNHPKRHTLLPSPPAKNE